MAAETTVKKSKGANDPWTFKTSFSLPNAIDPISGLYLGIQNLMATLTDADGSVVETRPLTNTVAHGVDFFYSQNAGYNGPSFQLVDNANVADIEKGNVAAADGVTKDDFAGNNALLGDLATLSEQTFTIATPGDYSLTLTGTLQGVAGVMPLNFGVTKEISYSSSCTQ